MKISIDENRGLIFEEVFSGIILKTTAGEEIGICMRDTGFEFQYAGVWYGAKCGALSQMKASESSLVFKQAAGKECSNGSTSQAPKFSEKNVQS